MKDGCGDGSLAGVSELGEQARAGCILLVVFQQQAARLLIEGRFGVGVDQQALDGQKHVPDAQLSGPVPLEHVDTYLAIGAHIRVEDLRQEVALGRGGREVLPQQEFHAEEASGVRGPLRALNGDLQVGKVLLVGKDLDAVRWVSGQRRHLLVHQADDVGGQVLHVGVHDCSRPGAGPPGPLPALSGRLPGRGAQLLSLRP